MGGYNERMPPFSQMSTMKGGQSLLLRHCKLLLDIKRNKGSQGAQRSTGTDYPERSGNSTFLELFKIQQEKAISTLT